MKKGFTLIELLAVIVILAIIALIATPIILNIIDDARVQVGNTNAKNYLRAAELSIADYNLNNKVKDMNCTVLGDGNLRCDGIQQVLDVDIAGTHPTAGMFRYENGKISNVRNLLIGSTYYSTNAKNEVVINSEKQAICTLTDSDNDKDFSIGDEVQCGTEKFYIAVKEQSTVSLFAEKNIEITLDNPKQSDNAGTIAFSDTKYWWDEEGDKIKSEYPLYYEDMDIRITYVFDENSNTYQYVKAYEDYLRYSVGVSSANARLINAPETDMLFKMYLDNWENSEFIANALNTNYWFGTYYQLDWIFGMGNVVWVYPVTDYYNSTDLGIRPVVDVNINDIAFSE